MQVKIKKLHPNAVIPDYSKAGDAGLDLTAISKEWNEEFGYFEYGTGLAIEIPWGYVGLIFPRSSISNTIFTLSNSVGVIDSGYRGEIKFRFYRNHSGVMQLLSDLGVVMIKNPEKRKNIEYKVGDRIGQLLILPYPQIEFVEVNELDYTERSTNGFGSTGK